MAAPINPTNSVRPSGPPKRPYNPNFRGRRIVEAEHKINSYIRAREVRLVGENVEPGVFTIGDALRLSEDLGLDLVEISPNAEPPVCKIANYGKYLYSQSKKEKKMAKPKGGELKEIRLTFKISPHDMEIRANQAKKFLDGGDKIKINMSLRGREKAMGQFATDKVKLFLEKLNLLIPIKTERELKREPRGFTMIVSKQ